MDWKVLFFIKLKTREVHIAGMTAHPNEAWMMQVVRNLIMDEWDVLKPGQYLIHDRDADRDAKFCASFQQLLDGAGVKRRPLPPRSPNLNAIAERWVRTVKSEALSRFILFGERSLRQTLVEYLAHYHEERCHQGLGNVIPFPKCWPANDLRYERLGGLLKHSERQVA